MVPGTTKACFIFLILTNITIKYIIIERGFLGASVVKDSNAMQVTRIQSLGWEDPLEKEMAAHSSILAWKIPWIKEPGGLQSVGLQKSQTWLSN